MKILFILKRNTTYGFQSYCRRSSGLWNSTNYIVEALKELGVHAAIIELHDNNQIDHAVSFFKPEIVVIEALWVVPQKFDELKRLHPKVKWFVHLHSHMSFLALEGISIEWIFDYAKRGVGLIANSGPSYWALRTILPFGSLIYLPNVYRGTPQKPHFKDTDAIHIGCFGAIRPLKNQLIQAMAAVEFASQRGKYLFFHINGSRVETNGEPVLKCLRSLFRKADNCTLVEHDWLDPEDFHKLLHTMDLGMQVSLTETFNHTTADYVTAGLPVVVSKEITWVSGMCQAKDDSVSDIIRVMHRVWGRSWLVRLNQWFLSRFSQDAAHRWFRFIRTL